MSQVIPVLVAVLICDVAVADPSTGKKNLIGVFDRINVGRFPTEHPMSVYLKLADAEGTYRLKVRYVRRDSGAILAEVQGDLQVANRLQSCDLVVSFPPLPIQSEGRFEFQIWSNDIFLGGTFMDAVARPQPPREKDHA